MVLLLNCLKRRNPLSSQVISNKANRRPEQPTATTSRNPLSSQVISNLSPSGWYSVKGHSVVIPYQVRSYQTFNLADCHPCRKRRRNPLSSQVISNTGKRRRNCSFSQGRNPLSSQVISNEKKKLSKVAFQLSGRNPLSSQVISNPSSTGGKLGKQAWS